MLDRFREFCCPTLLKVFDMRQKGKMQEARSLLHQAAFVEHDPEAIHVLSVMTLFGGLGYDEMKSFAELFMEHSHSADGHFVKMYRIAITTEDVDFILKMVREGYIFLSVKLDLEKRPDAFPIFLELADYGDGLACCQIAKHFRRQGEKERAHYYFRQGALQKVVDCLMYFVDIFQQPYVDKFECATFMTHLSGSWLWHSAIEVDKEYETSVLYLFGKQLSKEKQLGDGLDLKFLDEGFSKKAIQVFEKSRDQAQKSTFATILCLKWLGVGKDVATFISKFVWAQRCFWLK